MAPAQVHDERIVVVGAGLAGSLLATLLGRRDFEVEVYERRPDPRVGEAERGRSINLALSARGLAALDLVGLREEVLSEALPMPGRMVHPLGAEPNFQPYSADGRRAINSISRSGLNQALLDVAEQTPGVTLHFGERLEGVDLADGVLSLTGPDGPHEVRASVVFGNDGAYSAARRAVQFAPGTSFRADMLGHGYKELTIPPRDGEFALDPEALHIWPRGESMMIALPNTDRSFTCTLFWPASGPGGFDQLTTADEITGFFAEQYPDAMDLIPDLVDDYQYNPVGSLVTVRCWPWVASGPACRVALVGDAAHAIVPFYGQGANCAFEDAIEIDRLLGEYGADWDRVLEEYQHARKANTDAIAEMALENLVEMSSKVTSPAYQFTTAVEHALERRLGSAYSSKYELVSFSTMPYSRIKRRVLTQRLGIGSVVAAAAAGAVAATRAVRRRR